MNKSKILACLCVLVIAVLVTSCVERIPTATTTTTNPPVSTTLPVSPTATTTVSPDNIFVPGQVLAGLPVYPGATPTTLVDPNMATLIGIPASNPAYNGTNRPGFQSANVQYYAPVGSGIIDWYTAELTSMGYTRSGTGGGSTPVVGYNYITFFRPSQPLVGVEVHLYNRAASPPVFELLVTNQIPLPKPAAEMLPTDITSVRATFYQPQISKTFTDSQTINLLVSMGNGLPVRPDYLMLGGPGSFDVVFYRLIFHSAKQGDITIEATGGGVQFGSYPVLDDPHNLLRNAVAGLLGIPLI